jgi:hypothetical protein
MGAGALASRSWQRWLARYRLHEKLGLPAPVAPGGGSPGSGLNFFTSEIDKTPASTGAWVDVDVSGDGVPEWATGAILRLYNGATTGTVAVRKNGPTDTRTPYIVSGHHTGAMAGLDGSRVFEAYIHNASDRVYLIGYTTDSTDFLTNSVDKSPASVGAWVDVDVSADIPSGAVGIIVELVNTSTASSYNGGVRDNGSTDTFTLGEVRKSSHYYQVCGVDASRVFEAQIASAAIQVWLIGCFMPPISFESNAVGYALGGAGAWTDITVSGGNAPADADGAMWLVKNTASTPDYSGGVRKNSSGDESYALVRLTGCHAFFTGLDDSRIAEGKIENLAVDHYVIGYARPAAGVTQKTVTDALGLADVPAVEGSLTLGDSLALADAINVSVQKLITDALALAESLSLKGSVFLMQGLNLSDAVGLAARLTVADALTLAETVILKQFKSIADGLALADQVARVVLVVRLQMLASLLKEGLSLSGTEGPALTLSAISGRGLQLESTMKGG